MTRITVETIKAMSDLPGVCPEPLPFFKKGEFRRYKSKFMDAEWHDGSGWSRGATAGGAGLLKGIAPCERKHTDYQIEDGRVVSASNFFPEEYSEKTRRFRKSLPIQSFESVEALFLAYLAAWNRLVTLDQRGSPLGKNLLRDDVEMGRIGQECPFQALRATKEYLNRRKGATGPLRHKRLHRLNSIPMDLKSLPGVQTLISDFMKTQDSDLRRVISCRLVRKSNKRYLVCFTYANKTIREVDLSDNSINFCRDPRLVDMGCAFSEKGLSIVTQDAYEGREFYTVSSDVLKNVKRFLNTFFKEFEGKVRSISLDGSDTLPSNMRQVHKEFVRRCNTLKAVGAIEFYLSPKLVSLGERYSQSLPYYHPNHLKVWEYKYMKEFLNYTIITGLTGVPYLVRNSDQGIQNHKGEKVGPELMANYVLQLALAKHDMWHGATFMDRGTCRTVRKRLDRNKEKAQQKTSVLHKP